MSKQLLLATAICGTIFMVAPMAGIAEPTQASIAAEQQVAEAQGFWEKGAAILKGAKSQVGGVWSSVTDVDERLIRKDEQLKLANEQIIALKAEVNQKRFVSGLGLAETKACVITITEFLTTQVEGK